MSSTAAPVTHPVLAGTGAGGGQAGARGPAYWPNRGGPARHVPDPSVGLAAGDGDDARRVPSGVGQPPGARSVALLPDRLGGRIGRIRGAPRSRCRLHRWRGRPCGRHPPARSGPQGLAWPICCTLVAGCSARASCLARDFDIQIQHMTARARWVRDEVPTPIR